MGETKTKTETINNRTFVYLLPILGYTFRLRENQFVDLKGVFILNEDYPLLQVEEEVLHVLFEFTSENNYNFIKEAFSRHPKLVLKEYKSDAFHTVFIIQVPKEYSREFKMFVQSKYSKFSDNYKNSIIQFHRYSDLKTKDKKGKIVDAQGAPIIRALYKLEQGYIDLEEAINRGLPHQQWTRVPRGQEIGRKWDENEDSVLLETLNKEVLR